MVRGFNVCARQINIAPQHMRYNCPEREQNISKIAYQACSVHIGSFQRQLWREKILGIAAFGVCFLEQGIAENVAID